ncbi:MAG TPA: hypothetical protein VKS81_05535, partial [Bacteroidota bacterium]|nr:hypothetical protein [Bacteroidota bacterium]
VGLIFGRYNNAWAKIVSQLPPHGGGVIPVCHPVCHRRIVSGSSGNPRPNVPFGTGRHVLLLLF